MTTTLERYTTTAGEVIEYPIPADDVARYLARVNDAANDPRVSEGELVELVYSKDNPIMDATLFPGRGAVTKEVFANPVYHVMHDLLFAKRLQMEHAERMGEVAPGLTVAEAATQLEMSESAVRQAIRRGDLEAAKVRGAHMIDPASVVTYRGRVKRRGPTSALDAALENAGKQSLAEFANRIGATSIESAAEVAKRSTIEFAAEAAKKSTIEFASLAVRMGNAPGYSLRMKAADLEVLKKERLEDGGRVTTAVVPRFERVAIAISGKEMNRLFVLEPAEQAEVFNFGPFSIEGRFRIVEKVNAPAKAAAAWKGFKAS